MLMQRKEKRKKIIITEHLSRDNVRKKKEQAKRQRRENEGKLEKNK